VAKQTVLVTGGCGYIGSHVAAHLAADGAEVVVLDNLSTGFRAALTHDETLYVGDVGDTRLLGEIFARHQIDAILHFAAALVVPESVADPVKYYTNNTMNTLRLVDTATKAGIPRLIFSSTAAAYGQPERVPVRETDQTKPESPYGASKLMSERMLADIAHATGLRYVILRYFNVAGAQPGGLNGQRTPDATHLIKVACESAVGKRPGMSIYGTDYPTRDGTCIRDYIHVEDLATAHVMALRYLTTGGDSALLNCGYGRGSTVKEVVQAVKDVSGVDFPVELAPRRPGDVAAVVASADEIRQRLGWTPRWDDLRTIVQHAYAWEKQLAAAGR